MSDFRRSSRFGVPKYRNRLSALSALLRADGGRKWSEPPPRSVERPTDATTERSWPKRLAWAGFLGLVIAALAVSNQSLAAVLYVGGFVWLFGFGALGVTARRRSVTVHPDLPQDHPHFHITG